MDDFELRAREAIRDLVARYNFLGDRGRIEELLALFVPDAWIEVEGRPRNEGIEGLRALFGGAIRRPKEGTATWRIAHHVSSHCSDLEGTATDDSESLRASGHSHYLVLSQHGLDHWGRYRDVYCGASGRWLFESRRVSVDGLVPGGWADTNLQRG